MNPTDNSQLDSFSPCSTSSICGLFPKVGQCLKTPDFASTIQSNICGNGVREANEDCDCGSNCANDPCCDGTTCKFKNGAKCDDMNDACCDQCQLKAQGTVCRASLGVCDYQEQCSGTSASCPKNEFVSNGTPCNQTAIGDSSSGTVCASGVCTSRDVQCRSYNSIFQATGACPDQTTSCSITCTDGTSPGCVVLNGYFIGRVSL